MNNTSFVGNLTADPVLRTSAAGKHRATFSVAVNEGERGTDNEKTHFIDVTAFGTIGENLVSSLKKGQRVLVIGRFDQYEQDFIKADGSGESVKIRRTSFIASAVGPDLRWQTAQVAKVATNGQAAAPAAQPAAQPAAAPAAAPAPTPAPAAVGGSDDF